MIVTRPFYRLSVSVVPAAFVGSFVVAAFLLIFALTVAQLPLVEALVGMVIGVALYWGLEVLHDLGHAWAAARTGYPMQGLRFGVPFGLFAQCVYPPDEPPLPGRTHIQRALGGPIVSGIAALILLVLVLLTRESGDLGAWLLRWSLFITLMTSVGAFLPFGFTDGSTILYWLRR